MSDHILGSAPAKDVALSRADAELLLALCEAALYDPEMTAPAVRQSTSAVTDIIAHAVAGSHDPVLVPLNVHGATIALCAWQATTAARADIDDATVGRVVRVLVRRMWRLNETT